jgi:hypothetical protein
MTSQDLYSTHPDINAIDEAVMADDRRWFARHPRRLVRIRRQIAGEFLIDTLTGRYGQRPVIAVDRKQWQHPDTCPFVAVVDATAAMFPGAARSSDGTGARVRFPVAPHPRSRRKDIEDSALQMVRLQFAALRGQPPAP